MSDFLPEDVVVHILSRLPTKSVIRFRSVSKLWYSLITSPNFITSHFNQCITNPKNSCDDLLPLLVAKQCVFIRGSVCMQERLQHSFDVGEVVYSFDDYLKMPFPQASRGGKFLDFVGYDRGLFCFWVPDHSCFLWNPSIRKSISLPRPSIENVAGCFLEEYQGFGFDPRSNDYKVVRIAILTTSLERLQVARVEVFSLNAGSWKVSTGASNSFPLGCFLDRTQMPYPCFEGVVHWPASARGNWDEHFVLSFDFSSEVFKMIPIPSELAKASVKIRISVFGGLLSLVCDEEDYYCPCSIWLMKEYGIVESWFEYVKIDLNGGVRAVLGMLKNGHVLLEQQVQLSGELFVHDPWNKETKRLRNFDEFKQIHGESYEENLILLDKADAQLY